MSQIPKLEVPLQPGSLQSATSFVNRARWASAWTILAFGMQSALQLASNLLLTRILFPEAFGLMAVANVVLIGLAMFSDIGIKPSIIQNRNGDDPTFLNTAWTIQIIRGFLLWAVACMIAWPVSIVYEQPVLFPLICVFGATAAVTGFATIMLALAEKRMILGNVVVAQVIGQVISLLITAATAWHFKSVWALAYGAVAGSIVSTLLGHVILKGHVHELVFDRASANAMIKFGKWIFLGTIVTFMGGQGLRAIQAGLVSMTTVGILTIAQTFAWMPGDLASKILGSVGFPAMAEAATRSTDEFKKVLKSIKIKILIIIIPAFVILAFSSDFIISNLYDSRYHDAGRYMAILCLGGAISVVPLAYQNAFLALGNSKILFAIQTNALILRIAGMIIGFWLFSVEGMLIGLGIGSLFSVFIVIIFAYKANILELFTDFVFISIITIFCILMIII